MDLSSIRFISKGLAASNKNSRFLNFVRMAALAGVTLGSLALIISLSVLGGFQDELENKAVKFRSHITVNTLNGNPITDIPEKSAKLKSEIGEIASIEPVITREGLIRGGKRIEGISVRSISQNNPGSLKNDIIEGKFSFSNSNADEVIIGKRLAEKLNIKLGDDIIIYVLKGNPLENMPDPSIRKFRITGIYQTGMAQYDDVYIYIPFNTAVSFMQMPEGTASILEITLKDVRKAEAVSEKVNDVLGFPHYSISVYRIHSAIFAWIDLQKEPIPIVLGLISIVAVLNIITTLLISVVEKTDRIGILRSLGMRRKHIIRIFMIQGTSIGLAGTLTGCLIAFVICWTQQTFEYFKLDGNIYFLDAVPIEINFWHYLIVISVSVLMSFLSTFIPARIAAGISPLKALRFK